MSTFEPKSEGKSESTKTPKNTPPKSNEYTAVKVAMLGAFAKLLETGNEFAQIAKTQFEFKGGTAMRAVACDLFRKAAVQTGTAEAIEACADKLLSIAEAQDERDDKRMMVPGSTVTVEDEDGGNGIKKNKKPAETVTDFIRKSAGAKTE